MEATEKLGLMAELQFEHCNLSHGPGVDNSKIQAEDWLVIPTGDLKTKVVTDKLAIPICAECAEGLTSDEWILLYCVECLDSQWIYRPLSKMKYNRNLVLCVGCKNCAKKAENVFPV